VTSSTSRAFLRARLVLIALQGVLLVIILARWGRGARLDSAARGHMLRLAGEEGLGRLAMQTVT